MITVLDAEFVVYGRNIDEIETRAEMVARRFLGERAPKARMSYVIEEMGTPADLWKATVTVSWEAPDA